MITYLKRKKSCKDSYVNGLNFSKTTTKEERPKTPSKGKFAAKRANTLLLMGRLKYYGLCALCGMIIDEKRKWKKHWKSKHPGKED